MKKALFILILLAIAAGLGYVWWQQRQRREAIYIPPVAPKPPQPATPVAPQPLPPVPPVVQKPLVPVPVPPEVPQPRPLEDLEGRLSSIAADVERAKARLRSAQEACTAKLLATAEFAAARGAVDKAQRDLVDAGASAFSVERTQLSQKVLEARTSLRRLEGQAQASDRGVTEAVASLSQSVTEAGKVRKALREREAAAPAAVAAKAEAREKLSIDQSLKDLKFLQDQGLLVTYNVKERTVDVDPAVWGPLDRKTKEHLMTVIEKSFAVHNVGTFVVRSSKDKSRLASAEVFGFRFE